MSDHVFLRAMEFEGRHGVSDEERAEPQVIMLDIDLELDLRPAGTGDDLDKTANYSSVFEICRAQAEGHSYKLLEALGENIASDVLEKFPGVQLVTVTVRKPGVPIDGVLDHAGISVERSRS
jgi:dihydroneopterin aldolase